MFFISQNDFSLKQPSREATLIKIMCYFQWRDISKHRLLTFNRESSADKKKQKKTKKKQKKKN